MKWLIKLFGGYTREEYYRIHRRMMKFYSRNKTARRDLAQGKYDKLHLTLNGKRGRHDTQRLRKKPDGKKGDFKKLSWMYE